MFLTCADADPARGAVFPVLLFPDGRVVLEGVDSELTGGEGFCAMGATNRDENADFTDDELAGAVVNDNVADVGPSDADLLGDLLEDRDRHRFVSLIFECDNPLPVGLIAHHAAKERDRAIRAIVCLLIDLLYGKGRKGDRKIIFSVASRRIFKVDRHLYQEITSGIWVESAPQILAVQCDEISKIGGKQRFF